MNVNSFRIYVAEGFSLPNLRDLKAMVLWRSKDLRYIARSY